MSRILLVMPDDTSQPLRAGIEGAQESVRVKMFMFSDPGLMNAVIATRKRGVDGRVMLNAARRSGEAENEDTRKTLTDGGVTVQDSNPAFDLTYGQSMFVDASVAYIMSLHWETRNVTEARDYAIVTTHRHEVEEVVTCFEADWHRQPFEADASAHLNWCNSNGRERFAHFVDRANHTLWL